MINFISKSNLHLHNVQHKHNNIILKKNISHLLIKT